MVLGKVQQPNIVHDWTTNGRNISAKFGENQENGVDLYHFELPSQTYIITLCFIYNMILVSI